MTPKSLEIEIDRYRGPVRADGDGERCRAEPLLFEPSAPPLRVGRLPLKIDRECDLRPGPQTHVSGVGRRVRGKLLEPVGIGAGQHERDVRASERHRVRTYRSRNQASS